MKLSRIMTGVTGATLLLAGSAFASDTNKGSLHLEDNVQVEGKQLRPGNYRVEWNGTGPNVELKILNGKNTIATVPARVVTGNASPNSDGYATKKDADGTTKLTQIFFSGKKYELDLGQGAQAATGNPGS